MGPCVRTARPAAMELTGERGFDNIGTVAEIAGHTVTHER
jgi:hypothetical protein